MNNKSIKLKNNFDLLRLLFALMVVLSHAATLTDISQISWLKHVSSGTFAVQGFFYISGFLIFKSFETCPSLLVYFKRRLFRIAPAYIVAVTIVPVFLVSISQLPSTSYFTNKLFWDYLKYNLILSNFLAPTLPGVFVFNPDHCINGSLWTIKIEVLFYLCVPFIIFLGNKVGKSKICFFLFLGSIIWNVVFLYYSLINNDITFLKISKQLPGQLAFFMGGAYSYYNIDKLRKLITLKTALISVLFYVITSGLVHECISPICITIICFYLSLQLKTFFTINITSDLSYGIYLFHYPIIQSLISIGLIKSLPVYTFTIVSLLITIIAANLSWVYVESPFLRKSHLK
jgi:peptidoglycan/LPS O-acetylase OafA/YrhL